MEKDSKPNLDKNNNADKFVNLLIERRVRICLDLLKEQPKKDTEIIEHKK